LPLSSPPHPAVAARAALTSPTTMLVLRSIGPS
jgi:hypothetical protein